MWFVYRIVVVRMSGVDGEGLRESFWEGESDGGNGNDDALYGFYF